MSLLQLLRTTDLKQVNKLYKKYCHGNYKGHLTSKIVKNRYNAWLVNYTHWSQSLHLA